MLKSVVSVYFAAINVIALLMMKQDKVRARQGKRRTPEKSLWLAALVGGGPGAAAGMNIFRHKTKHAAFKIGLPLLAAADLLLYGTFLLQ